MVDQVNVGGGGPIEGLLDGRKRRDPAQARLLSLGRLGRRTAIVGGIDRRRRRRGRRDPTQVGKLFSGHVDWRGRATQQDGRRGHVDFFDGRLHGRR